MTEKEAAQILAIIKAANPKFKVDDAATTVKAWVWILGDYPADQVLEAAKHHILTSPFLPTPADIRKGIIRNNYIKACDAAIAARTKQAALEAGTKKALKAPEKTADGWSDERVRQLFEDMGITY